MSTMLEYKGYFGSVEYDDDNELFHGRLEFIRDLATYEGTNAKQLKTAFHEAVDDYLTLCKEQDKKPDVPLKGSFNIRPGQTLHRRAIMVARRKGVNLNTVVSEALQRYLDHEDHTT